MKAAVVHEPGAAPAYGDFDDPRVREDQAEVELVAAGIHHVVRARASGQHYSASGLWPVVPGVDAVARTPDGRLVYTGFVDAPWGTMAERMAVPAQFGMELPEGADPLAVAAGMNPGVASWLPLSRRAEQVGANGLGTVMILGATGLAGSIAVDNAYALGATAVVAVGRDEQRLRAIQERTGRRDLRIVALGPDPAGAIGDALAGRPPSIVIDFVWGAVAEAAFAALGRPELDTDDFDVSFVEVGSMAGDQANVPAALLRSKTIALTGSGLGSTPIAEIMTRLPKFLAQIGAGTVHVPYTAYPLSRVDEAWTENGDARAVVVPG